MRTADRNFWIQTAIVAAVIAGLVAVFAYSETKPLQADELAVQVADLRSLCSTGKKMFEQNARGELTQAFFDDQIELMRDNITSLRDDLDTSNAEPNLHKALSKSRELANRADVAFYDLTEGGRGEQAARDLGGLVESLKQLEDELKQEVEK
jgi:hypothetical protein